MNFRVRCPLFKVSPKWCAWVGTVGNLENHVTDSHADILKRGSNFDCQSVTNNALLILYNSEVFLYYKCIKDDGMWYALVQHIGITNKKYKYTIKILSVDNIINCIMFRFRTSKISETFKRIFVAGRCMAIEQTVLKPFIRNDRIRMTVTIEEFVSNTQTVQETSTLQSQ
jgi:hypothetical protein